MRRMSFGSSFQRICPRCLLDPIQFNKLFYVSGSIQGSVASNGQDQSAMSSQNSKFMNKRSDPVYSNYPAYETYSSFRSKSIVSKRVSAPKLKNQRNDVKILDNYKIPEGTSILDLVSSYTKMDWLLLQNRHIQQMYNYNWPAKYLHSVNTHRNRVMNVVNAPDPCLTHQVNYSNKLKIDTKENDMDKGLSPERDKPSLDQLHEIKNHLISEIRNFLKLTIDNSYLHRDVVLENNYFSPPVICCGLMRYNMYLLKIRAMLLLKHYSLSVEILSASVCRENSQIVIRWHIKGFSYMQTLIYWFSMLTFMEKSHDSLIKYYDGVSTIDISPDSQIIKHRVDRVMVDRSPVLDKHKHGLLKPFAAAAFSTSINRTAELAY